jgi:hypothetical protein
MAPTFRYQDFVDEQRAGRVHGVFIDDTGSPGLRDTPGHLHPQRKSWVAVVVSKSQISEVWREFPPALAKLKSLTGASEFHFTDIYNRARDFKDVPIDQRLGIFAFMAHIFSSSGFPVFVQTLDPKSLEDVRGQGLLPERFGPFNLKKHVDLALLLLLFRSHQYLEKTYPDGDRLARVFVDEGYKKNGVVISIPPLERVFADGLICFGRSDSVLPLQLADFAAFCLNRTQLLLGREHLSELDHALLQIIQPIVWNYQNIPQLRLDSWF